MKNPSRNLPLSLALGTGVVIALYIACNFIYLTALPLVGSPTGATLLERGIQYAREDRVATAVMTQMFGSAGGALMAVAIMISGFGCCNGLILSGARVYYAMAKDGLFFRSVARLHPTYKTPAVSLMVQMVWTCVLCISGSYGQLLDYIIFAVLVFYVLTIFGLFVLRRTHPEAERPYKAIGYPILPAIYIVMALFIDIVLLRYKPQFTWPGLFIVLLGIPVYYAWNLRQKRTCHSAVDSVIKERVSMSSLFATKSLQTLMQESQETGEHCLKRTLGPVNLIMLGIGAIIGAGLFVRTAAAIADRSGPSVTLAFIVAGIGCAFAGLCYAEFASMIPVAGSAYTYSYTTMGEIGSLDYRLGSRAGVRCRRRHGRHCLERILQPRA